MRTPLATSMKASFWGVVTMTAAVRGTTCKEKRGDQIVMRAPQNTELR